MIQIENPVYLHEVAELRPTLSQMFEEKGQNATMMERPINNHLKTPEEMEADFRKYDEPGEMNRRLQQDGYINIHVLDDVLSGCMEENY